MCGAVWLLGGVGAEGACVGGGRWFVGDVIHEGGIRSCIFFNVTLCFSGIYSVTKAVVVGEGGIWRKRGTTETGRRGIDQRAGMK